MRFTLIFKQALKDFKNKVQLYLSFTIFIVIAIGLILGLFSFNFSVQGQFNDIQALIPAENAEAENFRFVSVNGNHLRPKDYQYYQIEDGEYSKWVYHNILEREFVIQEDPQNPDPEKRELKFRKFTPNEMKVLWNSIGFADENGTINQTLYFDNNFINRSGQNYGGFAREYFPIYQNELGITTAEMQDLFKFPFTRDSENHSIQDDRYNPFKYDDLTTVYTDTADNKKLTKMVNLMAYYKVGWTVWDVDRWFSDNPDDEFYDQNFGYSRNLMLKYIHTVMEPQLALEAKINPEKRLISSLTAMRLLGAWQSNAQFPGATLGPVLMPQETWMDEEFFGARDDNGNLLYDQDGKLIRKKVTSRDQDRTFDHTPADLYPQGFNRIKIVDQLSREEINRRFPGLLESGNYTYVNPQFLHIRKLKLGDTIELNWNKLGDEPTKFTIIGTAINPYQLYQHSNRTTVFFSFGVYLKMSNPWRPWIRDYQFVAAKENFVEANRMLQEYLYKNFRQQLVRNLTSTNFPIFPEARFQIYQVRINMLFYNLLTYLIGLMTLILLLVVFYFITDETIKLQKKTLFFLKAMGESNFRLSLITTANSIFPLLIGTIFGILTSFGVSQIMASINSTFLPFYVAPFSLNYQAILLLLGVLILTFFSFLGITFAMISGKALKMTSQHEIGWPTKMYIAIKPAFAYMKSNVRIGISFVAKNVFKNILTLFLLTLSFGVVLFSVQFRSSSLISAKAFENRYTPNKGVMYNNQNETDALKFNYERIKKLFPDSTINPKDPNWIQFNNIFSDYTFASGPITTYKDGDGQDANYRNVSNANEPLTMKAITDDEPFNELIHHQIDELFKLSDELEAYLLKHLHEIDKITKEDLLKVLVADPQYDLKNHYLDSDYVRQLLLSEDPKDKIDHIFKITDDQKNDYADRVVKLVRKIELAFKVEIYPKDKDDQLREDTKDFLDDTRQNMVETFTQSLLDIRNNARTLKDNFEEFDYGVNIYFNRHLLPSPLDLQNPNNNVFALTMSYNGSGITGIGLDPRSPETAKMILKPQRILPLMSEQDFARTYNYSIVDTGDDNREHTIQVHALDVYVSGKFADWYHIQRNAILPVAVNGFTYDDLTTPQAYVRVVGIVEQASFLREIYFNKIDLFRYLQLNQQWQFEDKIKAPEDGVQPPIIAPLSKSIDNYFTNSLKLMKDDTNPNARDMFNNSVFARTELPYGISNLGFVSKMASGYSLLSYTKLPIFYYASENNNNQLGGQIYVFRLITESLLTQLDPVVKALTNFIVLLILITLAVAFILITLILLENRNVILLFKALGYRQSEINGYLTLGYINAMLIALVLGGVIAYFGIRIASNYLVSAINISLFFVWSPGFILTAVLMGVGFIFLMLVSVNIYTSRLRPNQAFEAL